MFNIFKKQIEIQTVNNRVYIRNIETYEILEDIKTYWGTDKITNNMFFDIGKKYLATYLFFIPDIIYMCDTILKDGLEGRTQYNKKSRKRYKNIRSFSLIREKLYKQTIFNSILNIPNYELDINTLSDFNLKPLDKQKEFLEIYLKNKLRYHLNGFLLAGTPGSGKTMISLYLKTLLGKTKSIIICPKNAIGEVWVNHIKNKAFKTEKTYSTTLDYNLDLNCEYIIIHYEELTKKKDELLKLDFSNVMISIDESHNFNEKESIRTKELIDFCKQSKCQDILLMSGTPIKNSPYETISLFSCIDKFFTDEVSDKFKKLYRQNNERGSDILSNRLGLVHFKISKSDIGLEEPKEFIIKIKIPNGNDYTLTSIKEKMNTFINERYSYYSPRIPTIEKIYKKGLSIYEEYLNKKYPLFNKEKDLNYIQHKEYLDSLYVLKHYNRPESIYYKTVTDYELNKIYPYLSFIDQSFAKEWKDIRAEYKYLDLVIKGECLGRVLGKSRIQCHVDMVKYIDFNTIIESTSKKTLIYTSFNEVINECNSFLKEKGFDTSIVNMETNKNLNTIISDFKNIESKNPLIATYKSLSTAVPLTMADNIILIDTPFRDYILQQTIARTNRLDSNSITTVWYIELDTGSELNISQRSKEILAWSQKQVNELLGKNNIDNLTDLSLENYQYLEINNNWLVTDNILNKHLIESLT